MAPGDTGWDEWDFLIASLPAAGVCVCVRYFSPFLLLSLKQRAALRCGCAWDAVPQGLRKALLGNSR